MLRGDVLFISSDNEVRLSNLRTLDGDVVPAATVTYRLQDAGATVIQPDTAMMPDPQTPGDYVANFDAGAVDISLYEGVGLELLVQATGGPQLSRLWRQNVGVEYSGFEPAPPVP